MLLVTYHLVGVEEGNNLQLRRSQLHSSVLSIVGVDYEPVYDAGEADSK